MFQKERSTMHKNAGTCFDYRTIFYRIIAWIVRCVGINKSKKCQHLERQQTHCGKFRSENSFKSFNGIKMIYRCSVRHSNVMNENIGQLLRDHHHHRKIKFNHPPHWIRSMNIPKKSISLPSMTTVNDDCISKKVAKKITSTDDIRQMRGSSSSRPATELLGATFSKRPAARGCIISIFWADTI